MMVIPNRGRVVAVISALALAGGLLTLALLAKPSQAQGNGAVSEQLPQEFTLNATECAGELINVTGTLHTVNHFVGERDPETGDPVGQYHINSHFNFQNGKGVGLDPDTGEPNGNKYVIPFSGVGVENVVADGQIVTGTVDINLEIGQGQLPNEVPFARLHFVIDDGEVKVENVHFHFQCQE